MCFQTSESASTSCTKKAHKPRSVIEQERLDAQAAAIVEMIGGNPCLAPIDTLSTASTAVDIGCGTGVATIQIAQKLPATKVYGLDISPVPEHVQRMAPSNVAWAVGNILDVDWNKPGDDMMSREIFTPGGLGYIFGRMLFLGINDWPRYFSTIQKTLKSGGIVEHQDLDWKFYRVGTSECLSDSWEWHRKVVQAAEQSGLSTRAGSEAAPMMRSAGLEVMSTQEFEFSFVPSRKTPNSEAMGRYVQTKLLPQYPELLRKMLGSQDLADSEIERLIQECLRDISSEEGIHQKYTVTLAKKA